MLLSKLKQLVKKKKPAMPRVPDGLRIYAIGDIHGRLDLFDALIAQIAADHAMRPQCTLQIILLGDLMDRGPESAGVVARAMEMRDSGQPIRFLMGNHEEVFLLAARGDEQNLRYFVRIGGRSTILSYGITEDAYNDLGYDELVPIFNNLVPDSHIDFINSFEDQISYGDYHFVHAGIRPGVALDKQKPSDLRWIRQDFLNHHGDYGQVIIHGHTITDDVDEQANRIGIDTGAYKSGRLTAIALEGDQRWYLST